MGLMAMLKGKGVKSDALAVEIEKLRSEVIRLQAEHDQAEAAAVAAAADDGYADAALAAEQIKGKLDALRERLARLERAHAEASADEQRDYVARLESKLAAERARILPRRQEIVDATKAEEERHERARADLQREHAVNETRCQPLENELRLARAGVPERNIRRAAELKRRVSELAAQIDELAEPRQLAEVDYRNKLFRSENPGSFRLQRSDDIAAAHAAANDALDRYNAIDAQLVPLKQERSRLLEEIRKLTTVE